MQISRKYGLVSLVLGILKFALSNERIIIPYGECSHQLRDKIRYKVALLHKSKVSEISSGSRQRLKLG